MEINSFSLPNIGLIIMSALLILFIIYIWNKAKTNSTPQQQKQFTKPILRFVGIYSVYFIIICFLANAGFFLIITSPPRLLLGFVPVFITVIILIRQVLSNR